MSERGPAAPLLEVRDLRVHFSGEGAPVRAVDGVWLRVERGETLGLVGESGCGKSTLARTLVGLQRPTGGSIRYAGREIGGLGRRAWRPLRRRIQLVFQDPYASLNPRMTVAATLAEPLAIHGLRSRRARRDRTGELLELVGIDPSLAARHPHAFSGGQRQRIGLARALALEPELLVLDEPVSALDVSIQAQVLNLLSDLRGRLGLTCLLIAHDLAVVRHMADRVAVMYRGRVVEVARGEELFGAPLHPYTQALLSAVPVPDPRVEASRPRTDLRGEATDPVREVRGCAFRPRCPRALARCATEIPRLVEARPNRWAACLLAQDEPPGVRAPGGSGSSPLRAR